MIIGALIDFVNFIIDGLVKFLSFILGLLPKSPFVYIDGSSYSDYISKINYILPIYEFIGILEAWLVAVALYYVYSIGLRWIKAID